MRIFLIDPDIETREVLYTRVQEALRQARIKHIQVVDGDFDVLTDNVGREAPRLAFLGPGCYQELEDCIARFRTLHPSVPLAIVLANEVYWDEAVELRRVVSDRIMPIADIVQMAQFVLDYDSQAGGKAGSRTRGVVTLVQFKGGVGTTTLATSLASCWAQHDLNTVLVDFDDVNPQATEWGGVGLAHRKAVVDSLREGGVPEWRMQELLFPVEGYKEKLFVVGQPEGYGESFHFKADVLEDAPSSADFVRSLLPGLQSECDVVVVDAGRSWGVSTFAALPFSHHILLMVGGDLPTLKRSLQNFSRFYRESDDPAEFDLSKWTVVVSQNATEQLSPRDVLNEIEDLDLFPETIDIFTIPFSAKGCSWDASGEGFYELAEPAVREVIEEIAFSRIPFRRQHDSENAGLYDRLKQHFHKSR